MRQIALLVKNGLPLDFVLDMEDAEKLAFSVAFGELEGGKFNWNRLEWEKDK